MGGPAVECLTFGRQADWGRRPRLKIRSLRGPQFGPRRQMNLDSNGAKLTSRRVLDDSDEGVRRWVE